MRDIKNVQFKILSSPSQIPIWGSELAHIGNTITITTARFNQERIQGMPGQLTGIRSVWEIDDEEMKGRLDSVWEWSASHPNWYKSDRKISVLHRDVILAKYLMERWGKKKLRHRITY